MFTPFLSAPIGAKAGMPLIWGCSVYTGEAWGRLGGGTDITGRQARLLLSEQWVLCLAPLRVSFDVQLLLQM